MPVRSRVKSLSSSSRMRSAGPVRRASGVRSPTAQRIESGRQRLSPNASAFRKHRAGVCAAPASDPNHILDRDRESQ